MISVRLKDYLNFYQNSVNRVSTKERDIEVAEKFASVFEYLQTCVLDNTATIKHLSEKYGVDKRLPKDATREQIAAFDVAQAAATKEYEKYKQQTLKCPHKALALKDLPGFQISTTDLVVMQSLGIIARGRQ
ncbi:MAG: hypothetical protein E4H01_03905 [Lysobacterales bacterium]|nr:MAG: hypothetical protein E4H01_03905 [Xanthomonadales bacterium]